MTDLIEILVKARDARIVAKRPGRKPEVQKRLDQMVRKQVYGRDQCLASFISHSILQLRVNWSDKEGLTIQRRRLRLAYLLAYRALVPHYEVCKRRWPVSYGLREAAE